MSLNSITLVGHAGRDPEVRFFESGTIVAHFTLAVNKPSNKRDEEPDWFNVEIWGKQAQVAADYVRKGSLIGVVGRMTTEQWTDRNTGEVRSKPLVKAERLALLGSKAGSSQPAGGAAAAPTPAQSSSTASAPSWGAHTSPVPSPAPAAPTWSSQPLSEEEVPF
jgi:single-strand DNA-binding protein